MLFEIKYYLPYIKIKCCFYKNIQHSVNLILLCTQYYICLLYFLKIDSDKGARPFLPSFHPSLSKMLHPVDPCQTQILSIISTVINVSQYLMIIFQYDASRETTYVNSIIQICYASVNRARVKKGRGIFYIYVRIEEGAQIQGSGLSMIMTSIQRPAPPTRYHTYAIINRRGERMMLARGLIYARFRLIFSPRYYITLTIISSSGEKIIEHTMIGDSLSI